MDGTREGGQEDSIHMRHASEIMRTRTKTVSVMAIQALIDKFVNKA